jgi:NADH:ubiquinone oxidoreductase subunit 6 (subunit J)
MIAALIIFYFFAALTIAAALFILFTKNVLHAVLALLIVFVGVSAMYVFAGADFLAITQLVVYVGGVLVLMLFGVMLTNRESGVHYPVSKNRFFIPGILSGLSVLGLLIYFLVKNQNQFISIPEKSLVNTSSTVKYLGVSLMSEYVLVFELVGILLLVALIGAAFVAGRKT